LFLVPARARRGAPDSHGPGQGGPADHRFPGGRRAEPGVEHRAGAPDGTGRRGTGHRHPERAVRRGGAVAGMPGARRIDSPVLPVRRPAGHAGGLAGRGSPAVVQAPSRRAGYRRARRGGTRDDAGVRRDVGVLRLPEGSLRRRTRLAAAAPVLGPRLMPPVVIAALAVGSALLVVAELGTRRWMRRRMRYAVWPPGLRLEVRQDPAVFPEMEPRVRFEVNADGERGGEVRRNEAGLYRILVAGGSSVECFALDQATSWPGALERLLNAPDMCGAFSSGAGRIRRVHVGNIGHSAVGGTENAPRRETDSLDRARPEHRAGPLRAPFPAAVTSGARPCGSGARGTPAVV